MGLKEIFYRLKALYDTRVDIVLALQDIIRRKLVPNNRFDTAIEEVVVQIVFEQPAYSHDSASSKQRKKGIFIYFVAQHSVWKRNNLVTFAKHLKALKSRGLRNTLPCISSGHCY